MRRELGQLSLADGLVEGGAGRNRQLERIAALVEWPAFERQLGEVYAAPVGRPSYGPLVLLKCLLLQQWYRLSDPGLEEALSDRLSFRRFVGLALADPVPDHSTLSRFRAELVRAGSDRAAAGRAQSPARRQRSDGQGWHADRREPGRGRLSPATQGRADRAPQ
jgi:transposase, IS5 family